MPRDYLPAADDLNAIHITLHQNLDFGLLGGHPSARRSLCPYCGHPVEPTSRNAWIEIGLRLLAIVALAFVLVPLGVMAWKSSSDFFSSKTSHSILFQLCSAKIICLLKRLSIQTS